MIKLIGISNEPITLQVSSAPKFYRKITTKPRKDGQFLIEVYKLRSFNTATGEANYVRQKDEKQKGTEQEFSHFPFSTKLNSFQQEE